MANIFKPNAGIIIGDQIPSVKRLTKIDLGLQGSGGSRTLSIGASTGNLLQLNELKPRGGCNFGVGLDCEGRIV
jgi:hypothetical protein